jgi:hypothetical protein
MGTAHYIPLPAFTDDEAMQFESKGWNLPQIWNLSLLKTVYLSINNGHLTKNSLYHVLDTATKGPRQIDEYCNALTCFGLINYERSSFVVTVLNFFDSSTNDLTKKDLERLSGIFFSYFRFKEISNWFLKPTEINSKVISMINEHLLVNQSYPIFATSCHEMKAEESEKKRFLTDTVFYNEHPTELLQLTSTQGKMMRFFDVFVNWGIKLGKLEVLNLSDGINLRSDANSDRKIKLYYFINDAVPIDVKDMIHTNYASEGRTISLPELTINLAFKYRCSLNKIHNEIIEQTGNSDGEYSLQRTSKAFISKARESNSFIRDREKLYPKLGNAFISHIILR